jgi:hypothetical protein
MKTISESDMENALRRALPGITGAEIKQLQEDTATLQHLSATHGWMLDSINGLLFKHDVEKLVFDDHDREYIFEAGKILMRLPDCASVDACQREIHSVMVKSFDGRVRPLADYAGLANDVWNLWRGTESED